MRKKLLLFFFLALFTIPLISAITTNLKQDYKPLETMILKIDGNFIDGIKQNDVFLYSDRLGISLDYDINKIGGSYYLYATLPNNERNYTLILKNIHYIEEGKEKTENIEFNFSIKGNVSLFSINPGFIITDKDFSIGVTSNNKEINVKSTFGNSVQNTSINAGTTKKILFSIKDLKNTSITKVTLESEGIKYEVPVEVFIYNTNVTIEKSSTLIFYPLNDTIQIGKNSGTTKKLYLFNNGTQDIKDLEIIIPQVLKGIVEIAPNEISLIQAGNYTTLSLVINAKESDVNGIIKATNNYYSIEFPISIKITGNQTLINQSKEELRTCLELSGTFCSSRETCKTEFVKTTESPNTAICCLGGCQALSSEEKSGSKVFVVVIIIILLIVIFYFIYKKFKVKKKTPERVIKERTDDYEEKFKSKEVRGNLKQY